MIDQHTLNAALRLFTSTFVVADKRTQIHKRLATADRRAETLETIPRWLAGRTAPLEGVDRSPAGLRARLGELAGIRLAGDGACRTTIVDALQRGRATPSIFIADNGNVALVTSADGPPLLCSRL